MTYLDEITDFGQWLKEEMRKRNIDCEELAKKTKLHPDSVRRYVSGKRVPDVYHFLDMLTAMGFHWLR